jgi:hypothetical protein
VYPVCSFCGERPPVAWFEGPDFRTVVDSEDKVRTGEAWLACAVCLAIVEADDREGLAQRSFRRADEGRERSPEEAAAMLGMEREHLASLFWNPRSR